MHVHFDNALDKQLVTSSLLYRNLCGYFILNIFRVSFFHPSCYVQLRLILLSNTRAMRIDLNSTGVFADFVKI